MKQKRTTRRGLIVDLLSLKSEVEILEILDEKFPPGVFKTSNKKALYGTKWDLDLHKKNS